MVKMGDSSLPRQHPQDVTDNQRYLMITRLVKIANYNNNAASIVVVLEEKYHYTKLMLFLNVDESFCMFISEFEFIHL